MPFVPIPQNEMPIREEPCTHPEHNPPGMMVYYRPMRWVCPACGAVATIIPPVIKY